jgi:hypothetical protein
VSEAPEWLPQMPARLARAMTLYRMGEFQTAAEVLDWLGADPGKQFTACCLLARMIVAKAPECDHRHEGPCTYMAVVIDPETGQRREWDDVGKAELFAVGFMTAMLHFDGERARELYVEALKDGTLTDGFVLLLARASETVNNSRQTVFFN